MRNKMIISTRLGRLISAKRSLETRLDSAYMNDEVIESMELEEKIQDLSMQIAELRSFRHMH